MKKTLGFIAAALLVSAPAMAADAPTYNCDYQPSCEVAPGIYGAMASPATSKFNLSVGGYVKLDYAYNSTNLGGAGANFLLPNGPIPKTTSIAGREDQSILTARQSRFWLKVAGPTFLGAKTNALIEADFFGPGSTSNENGLLRMRHAYGSLDWANTQVLFGQTQDIFGPMLANTIDFRQGAATGNPNNPRVAQLRLTQKVNFNANNSLKLVVGVQNPTQDNDNLVGDTTDTYGSVVNAAAQVMFVSKALGTAPGFYGMAMNNLTAGVFGLVGSEKVGVAPTTNRAVDSYGYGVYAFVPVLKSSDGKSRAMTMSFETQAYMAANMLFNSATGSATVGATPDKTGAKGYGIAGQVIFYPTQDLGITAGWQRRNAYDYANYTAANFEKFNELIYGNVAYDLNAAVRVATEFEHQKTVYGNNTPGQSDLGQDNTIRLAAYYFF
ncbi:MAG TPA: hypothetical protein VI298_05985 [Geobacteraceae bacterium]